MQLKAGSRWRSAVCDTEVIIVRAPTGDADLRCGGEPVVPLDAERTGGEIAPGHDGGTLLGKRYASEDAGLEVLCTKAGKGALSLAGVLLPVKEAKPLPSSD